MIKKVEKVSTVIIVFLIIVMNLFAEGLDQSAKKRIYFANDFTASVVQILSTDTSAGQGTLLMLGDFKENQLNNYRADLLDQDGRKIVKNLTSAVSVLENITIERQQLETIFSYRKSMAISRAIPNPINLIGTVSQKDPLRAIVALAGTAASSAVQYHSAMTELNLEKQQKNWEIDAKEKANLDDIKESLFEYIQKIGHDYEHTDSEILSRSDLEFYVKNIMNDQNSKTRLMSLLSWQQKYREYPSYWLDLVDTYHSNEQWENCLETLNYYYENFGNSDIYRQNSRLKNALIAAIDSKMQIIERITESDAIWFSEKLELLKAIIPDKDWLTRYYCSMVYLNIAAVSNDNCYEKAWDLLKKNALQQKNEQAGLMSAFIRNLNSLNDKDLSESISLPEYDTGLSLSLNTLRSIFEYCNENSISFPDLSDLKDLVDGCIRVGAIFIPSEVHYWESYFGFASDYSDLHFSYHVTLSLFGPIQLKIQIPALWLNNISYNTIFVGSSVDSKWVCYSLDDAIARKNDSTFSIESIKYQVIEDPSSYIATLNLPISEDRIDRKNGYSLFILFGRNDEQSTIHNLLDEDYVCWINVGAAENTIGSFLFERSIGTTANFIFPGIVGSLVSYKSNWIGQKLWSNIFPETATYEGDFLRFDWIKYRRMYLPTDCYSITKYEY